MSARPRVVVVGAGMAGLSAAHRLHQAWGHGLDLTILEGGKRIGGRIETGQLGGDRVELGATYIHGITGSPIYQIAERIGALSAETPFEHRDDKPGYPIFRAQGAHLPVHPQLVCPAMDLYRSSIALVKDKVVGLPSSISDVSVGAFLGQRLRSFLLEQQIMQTSEDHCNIGTRSFVNSKKKESREEINDLDAHQRVRKIDMTSKCKGGHAHRGRKSDLHKEEEEGVMVHIQADKGNDVCEGKIVGSVSEGDGMESCANEACSMWNPLLLQESAFSFLEAKERCYSGCDSLYDLDLTSLKEYTEYPGPHVTIGKGYASILKELENSLPPGTIKLRKKVQKIFWNHSHPSEDAPVVLQCEDGSVVQAEHAILTMSLGVLKAGVSQSFSAKHLPSISRSVQDLRGWKASKEVCAEELFKPSLPSWKLNAISGLGFGVVNKLFLLLDPTADTCLHDKIAFLHHKVSEGVPRWLKNLHSMFPIYEGSNVVLCWLAGEEALEMENLSDGEVLEGVAQMLSSFGLADPDESMGLNRNGLHGQTIGRTLELKQRLRKMLRGLLRSKWATNPLCQGSYSFVAVGSSGEDIDVLAKPLPDTSDSMVTPIEPSGKVWTGASAVSELPTDCGLGHKTKLSPLQLLFAGEATHRSFYSTTHGAFLSGVREADRLLNHYQKDSVKLN